MKKSKKTLKRAVAALATIIFVIIALLPVFFVFTDSFMTDRELSERFDSYQPETNHYTYKNTQPLYPYPFSTGQYWDLIANGRGYFFLYSRSLAVALAITAGQTAVCVAVGFLLGRFAFRGRAILFVFYVIVMFLPYSATLLPNYMTIRAMGLLDTQSSIILPAVFSPLGVVIMTIFAALVPQEVFDAALLETKNLFTMMWHIFIPETKPAIAMVAIISFSEAWNMVEQPQALMENRLIHPLSVSLNGIFSSGRIANFAACLLYMIPAVLLLFAFEDLLTNKIMNMAKKEVEELNVKD